MASIVLGAAGAALGAWAAPVGWSLLGMSGAQLGWSLGSMAGNMLFAADAPDVRTEGPRLNDLKIHSSTYGNPMPKVYGTYRLAGNMIWSTPVIETQHETTTGGGGGKGGGGGGSVTQISYTYSQSFALALCEGEIIGVRKIWANGELIYNVSDSATISTLAASIDNAASITIYPGSETQTANSLIQADVGTANCPAYRGTGYAVIEQLQLADYGNRTPNFEFEVIVGGTITPIGNAKYDTALVGSGYAVTYGGGKYVARGEHNVAPNYWRGISADGENWSTAVPVVGGFTYRPTRMVYAHHTYYMSASGFSAIESTTDGHNWTAAGIGDAILNMCVDGQRVYAITYSTAKLYYNDGGGWTYETTPAGYWQSVAAGNDTVVLGPYTGSTGAARVSGIWFDITFPLTAPVHVRYGNGIFLAIGTNGIATSADGVNYTLTASPTFTPTELDFGGGQFAAVGNGAKLLVTRDGVTLSQGTATGVASLTSLCYGPGYFVACGSTASVATFVKFTAAPVITASASPAVADIVTDICESVSLTAGDIDVTDLSASITGYAITRGTARSHLQQLMQVCYFDAVESDGKIKFVTRGGASVATIDEDDLGAHEYGVEPPEVLLRSRAQDLQLPREVSVSFPNINGAYQVSTQSDRRLTTDADGKINHALAVVMTPTKAREIASVLLYDTWASRTTINFATGWKYAYLEPTDVVTLTVDGRSYTVRITDEDASGGIFSRSGVLEESAVYTQTAEAEESETPDETLEPTPTTRLELLDIPLLRDQDDGIGFYAAASGNSDDWPGAQMFKSNDGGATWTPVGNAFLNAAVLGMAVTALGNFTQNIFDEHSSVSILLEDGALASDTEINILNGANVALLGDELIQFRDATLTATNTYTLTGLLRGRRGTEWARSTHAIGDRFVLLSESTTYLFKASSAEYDLERQYRAVSFGNYLDDAETEAFTHTAVELIPYAPVHLGGGRDASGNLTLNWIRRTRIAGGWNNYADVPLGEDSQAYEVEIYSSSTYATLKRTITGISSATTSYTAAQQTTDFGSPQATIYFIVYQVSATVGRGYEARGVI